MKYKTYNCNAYKVHTIKTDKFKTTHLEIIFRKKAVSEELCAYSFLGDILSESTQKYPRRKDLVTKYEELYKASVYASTVRTGNILNFQFISDFIDPTYISEDNYLEEIIKTIMEMVFNPNVQNDEFDLKTFKIVKERLKREIISIKDNPTKESIKAALKLIPGNSPSSFNMLGTIEELEEITPSSLYKTYKTLLKEFTCDIFVIGNEDMDELVTLINKYFKKRIITPLELDLPVHNSFSKLTKETKKSDNVQANLVMLLNISNLTQKEQDITMHVFNYIFGSGGLNSKLYQSIREKNSLCYGISSMYLKYDSLLLIHTSLENKNVDKAISLVKKDLQAMKNGDFTLDEVNDAINNMQVSIDFASDNNISVLNNYVFHEFANLMFLEERKKLFQETTKEDIINVAKKIKLVITFTLAGKE